MRPPGADCGDQIVYHEVLVRSVHVEPVWHFGVPVKATPEDRRSYFAGFPVYQEPRRPGRTDFTMDLKADQKVLCSPRWLDEMGNLTTPPAGATATYTVDNQDLLNVVDNGDNTAWFVATGTLGTANIHGEVTWNGRIATGDGQLVIVAGDAERFNLEFGTPEEATPDDVPATPV